MGSYELRFPVSTESGKVEELGGSLEKLNDVFSALTGGAGNLTGSMNQLAGAFQAGIVAGTAFLALDFGAKAIESAKGIGELAAAQHALGLMTGLTVTEVGNLSATLELMHTSIDTFQQGMRGLARTVDEGGTASKAARTALRELHVDLYDSAGNLKPVLQQWQELSTAFKALDDPTGQHGIRLASDLFSRMGQTLLPALLGPFDELIKKVKETGVALDESGAKKADDFAVRWGLMIDKMAAKWHWFQLNVALPFMEAATSGLMTGGLQGGGNGIPGSAFRGNAPSLQSMLLSSPDVWGSPASQRPQPLPWVSGFLQSIQSPEQQMAGLQETLRTQTEQLAAAEMNPARAAAKRDEIQQTLAQIANLQKQIDLTKQLAAEDMKVAAAAAQSGTTGLNPAADVILKINQASEGLTPIYAGLMGRGQLPQSGDGFFSGQLNQLQIALKKMLEDWASKQIAKGGPGETGVSGSGSSIEDAERALAKASTVIDEMRKHQATLTKEELEAQTSTMDREAHHQEQMLAMFAGPGGEIQALQKGLDIRLHTVDVEQAIKQSRSDLFDMTREQYRLDAERDTARFQFEEQIAQMHRAEINDYRNMVGTLFDSIANGTGISAALRQISLGWARTMVQNTAQLGFNTFRSMMTLPGQGSDAAHPNALGRILSGTPFGMDPMSASLMSNKVSIDANTLAVENLTSVMTGGVGVSGGTGTGSVNFGGLFRSFGFGGGGGTASGGAAGPIQQTQIGVQEDGTPIWSGDYSSSTVSAASANTAGLGGSVMKGVGLAGAGLGVAMGIMKGGTSGFMGAAGSALMGASMFAGPAAPFLMAAGMLTSLFGGLFGGDPKKARDAQEQNELTTRAYTAPTAGDVVTDRFGRQIDYDARGRARSLNSSGGGTPVVVQVQTMDAKSFVDNHQAIGLAVHKAILLGNPMVAGMRKALQTGV